MTLKDKGMEYKDFHVHKFSVREGFEKLYSEKDVKEAVLKFEQLLKRIERRPEEVNRFYLLDEYNKIFGNFKKV